MTDSYKYVYQTYKFYWMDDEDAKALIFMQIPGFIVVE